MKSKHFAVVGILAAAAMGLTGCGPGNDEPQQDLGDTRSSEPMGTTDDATTREPGMVGQNAGESMRDRGESALGGAVDRGRQSAEQGVADARDQMGQMGMGATETTEFAVLDADGSGDIDESEWERDAVQGAEFAQFDQDGNNQVDADEFRQGVEDLHTTQAGDPGQDDWDMDMPADGDQR